MALNRTLLQNDKITFNANVIGADRLPGHVKQVCKRLLSFHNIVPVEEKVRHLHLEMV